MKLILVAMSVAVSVLYVNANCCCLPPQNPPVQCIKCFNPKQALYEKFPLLYKLKSKFCKFYCDPLKEANLCPEGPPAPAPQPPILPTAVLPIQVSVAPGCPPATANSQLLSNFLVCAAQAASSCQPVPSACPCV